MTVGRKNTGMCQQLQLPAVEIVNALHGKKANAKMKSHSFLYLLVASLKVHQGHKVKKKFCLHLALGRSCKTELPKD